MKPNYNHRKALKVRHSMYILKKLTKIAWSSNDDKRSQTFDRITSYPCSTNEGKVCKTELLEYLNVKWLILMVLLLKAKLNTIQNGNIFQSIHTELIIGCSGSGKTNALLNLINNHPDIDIIYLYAKDPYEAKYQYVINKRD